jgi:hypothetical protein
MKTFLCVVSPNFPENYEIGGHAGSWGVEDGYKRNREDVSRRREGREGSVPSIYNALRRL